MVDGRRDKRFAPVVGHDMYLSGKLPDRFALQFRLLKKLCQTEQPAIGKNCVLHSGALRSEPYVERRLSTTGVIERRRVHLIIDDC